MFTLDLPHKSVNLDIAFLYHILSKLFCILSQYHISSSHTSIIIITVLLYISQLLSQDITYWKKVPRSRKKYTPKYGH